MDHGRGRDPTSNKDIISLKCYQKGEFYNSSTQAIHVVSSFYTSILMSIKKKKNLQPMLLKSFINSPKIENYFNYIVNMLLCGY